MTDHHTRLLREDELRAANTLFRAALHVKPVEDEEWARTAPGYQPERTVGVFDDALIGTARSTDAELTVPGGATLSSAAVTGVGVRADRTRRGVLTELMRAQFADFERRGVVAATLWASEGPIYGRFGYGLATHWRSCTVDRRRAVLRADVPAGGEVRLIDADEAREQLPGINAGTLVRAGMMTRAPYWWAWHDRGLRKGEDPVTVAVHHGERGPDGYVVYRVSRTAGGSGVLSLEEMHYANAGAFAGLWRFLLGVDLVDEIATGCRPVDEAVEVLFTDPRVCRVTGGADETWLRLLDVPAALAARRWRGEPLVAEVTDPVLERNSGRYRLGTGGAERTDEPAGMQLGVDALAMIYLGGWRPSALGDVGRIRFTGATAAAAADDLFGAHVAPWCGTFF
ncbi:GNAT family N-acetyltransferase [Prauserella cavernicola]|uniref:GNAT family N-acetyltransferase n=1 Tax=Prauserella cavernicola TaxID=2800127 RepID=A0A934QM89_9PSEU|nr:GNAT family N-acetyltransferase [Prauserella cavernicola]MBK1782961.1 GNAT family N-acetyltransferase [Prauserella cavernicola]